MIRVRTLGQCAIHIDSACVGPDAEIVFGALLLLTAERGRRMSRGELLSLLWPGASASRAAHCLRQTIYRLRTLGAPLEVDRTHLTVSPDGVDSDVDALLRSSRTDDVEDLAERVRGPFLPGYAPAFSEPLRDWVERERDLVAASARRVLTGAISARKTRGEWADVERLAHRCLAIDPLNEEATLALAEAAALHGGKVEAIGILDRYLREMGPTARELRLPAMTLRRRIAEPELEFPLAPPPHVPFVGRSAEMATLTAALRSARGGCGSVYFIHGEPGIGKTRLLSEFTRAATLEGARVASAICQSSDSRRPLSAFVDLVPKLMTMPGALGCSPQSHRYLRRFVKPHSTQEPPTPDTAEAANLYANVQQSLLDLLDAIASEAPLLVAIEDVQWLDAASWEIVTEAADWIATRRVMLVLTERDREPEATSTSTTSLSRARTIRLGPIDLASRDRLFEATLRHWGRTSEDSFRKWCAEMSGGNPYYLTELAVHGLTASGIFEVPLSLKMLVAQRVSRLQPVSCRVLQACAILGKNATLEMVEGVLDQRRTELLEAYDELARNGVLTCDDGKLVCHHDLVLEAALQRASGVVVTYLHGKAAVTLAESLRQDCQVSLAWDCAKHLLAAGQPSQAARQLMHCARHALELGRPLEADEILVGSLDLPLNRTERSSIQNERVLALRAADRWDDVVTVLSEMTTMESRGSSASHTDQELDLIQAKWMAGYEGHSLLASLRDCCRSRLATPSHRLLAARSAFMAADNICEPDVANEIYETIASDLTSGAGPDFDRAYSSMVYHVAFGDIAVALGAARELLAVLPCRSDVREIGAATVHVAEVLWEAGCCHEGTSLLQRAFHDAMALSLLSLACYAGRRLAWHAIHLADYSAAAEWVDVTLPMTARIQQHTSRADILGAAAEIALHKNDVALASELLADSMATWGEPRHARGQAFALATQNAIWIAEGNLAACARALPRFLALYDLVRRHTGWDQLVARLVRVLELTEQSVLANTVLQEYLSSYRRGRAPLAAELAALCEHKGLEHKTVEAVDQRNSRPRLLADSVA